MVGAGVLGIASQGGDRRNAIPIRRRPTDQELCAALNQALILVQREGKRITAKKLNHITVMVRSPAISQANISQKMASFRCASALQTTFEAEFLKNPLILESCVAIEKLIAEWPKVRATCSFHPI